MQQRDINDWGGWEGEGGGHPGLTDVFGIYNLKAIYNSTIFRFKDFFKTLSLIKNVYKRKNSHL